MPATSCRTPLACRVRFPAFVEALHAQVSDHTSFVNSIDVDRSLSGAGRIYSADGAGVMRIWQVLLPPLLIRHI